MASLQQEIWKAIPGYVGKYEVSNLGRVRSLTRIINGRARGKPTTYLKPGRILKPFKDGKGYLAVGMPDRKRKVHALVMLAFKGTCPSGYEINHDDGDKKNNRLSNLEYVTKSANAKHACHTGLKVNLKGEQATSAKLTVDQVLLVRRMNAEKLYSQSEMARQLNVSSKSINAIVLGKNWKHLL